METNYNLKLKEKYHSQSSGIYHVARNEQILNMKNMQV